MEEKRITKEEFDAAVKKAIEKVTNERGLEGMAAFIVPLTGATFAREMRDILFPEESEG